MERERLISEAEAAERLAQVVSYRPDKVRLLNQAAQLRDRAARCEERSWKAKSPS